LNPLSIAQPSESNELPQPPSFASINHDLLIYTPKYRQIENFKTLLSSLQLNVTGETDFLVISGEQKLINLARLILRQYDRPYDDIQVKVSVIEYLDNTATNTNLFAALNSKNFAISIGTNPALTNSFKIAGSTFSLVLSALTEDNRFNVLNTSQIRLVNGKEGRINVGNEVPVLSQLTQTNNGNPIQNIEYRNSGLILTVTPKVTNSFVLADIHQQLSNFVQTTTSNINSPTLTKRELKTVLSAKLGEVIIIGGLDSTQETNTTTSLFGIPLGQTKKLDTSSVFIVLEFNRT
jgi:Type II secretory pathway, component PulD